MSTRVKDASRHFLYASLGLLIMVWSSERIAGAGDVPLTLTTLITFVCAIGGAWIFARDLSAGIKALMTPQVAQ